MITPHPSGNHASDGDNDRTDISPKLSLESYELQKRTSDHSCSDYDPENVEVIDLIRHREQDDECEESLAERRRDSLSTIRSFMLYTPDEEQAVVRKLDRRLVLFVALLYMLSFLDRSNIGNAKIAGMYDDLHLSSIQFEWLLRAFYITYICFEWMTLLWKIYPPHIYCTVFPENFIPCPSLMTALVAVCVASWGLIASLQSLAFSFPSMLALRALLGIGEAAFVGVPFYMSFFYKRDELAFRTGLFISAAPLATSIAGSLAWAITKVGDALPIASWRMLFLVEGFPSIVAAVFVFLHIPDSPASVRYLTARERKVAEIRLRKETEPKAGAQPGLDWRQIRQTLLDPKAYLTAACFFCLNVAFSSLPVFLPTIISEMGHSTLTSQALTAPPFLLAFMAVILTAWLSDRYGARSPFVIFHALLASFGYAMMAIAGSRHAYPTIRYLGVYPASVGFFSAITIIITWTINNQKSDSGKGTGLAMLNYIGQLGPLVGVHLYPDSDQPYYVTGMSLCAGFTAAVAVLAYGLRRYLQSENESARVREKADVGEDEGLVSPDEKTRRHFVFMV